jgi:hypothetical protein
MKFSLMMAAVLLLCTACKPSDQKVRSVRERLEAGETVTFDELGYRRPKCRADWTDMYLGSERDFPQLRSRIVLNKQQSVISSGLNPCYRIGSAVNLNVLDQNLREPGRVQILRLSLVRREAMQFRSLKGKYFASSDSDSYVSKAEEKIAPTDYLTVVDFRYISGSAADEASLREKDAEDQNDPHYEETTQDGEVLSGNCTGKTWKYLTVRAEAQQAITARQLRSWYQFGELNCLKQGQDIALEIKSGDDFVTFAQAKVKKIKRFRTRWVKADYFAMPDFDFNQIREWIDSDNSKHDEFMSVVDFEIPEGSQVGGGQP